MITRLLIVGTSLKNGWMIDLELNGRMVTFKIDTDADVTVLPQSLVDKEKDG